MLPLYMLQAVDIRRAEKAGTARGVIAEKLTIPAIKFVTASHNPGGTVMGVDFALPRIDPIEPAFMVKGVDTDAFDGMGRRDTWVFACAYRNKKTGTTVAARGVIEGAITEWESDESSPEEFQGCNHVIKEVTHFEFHLDGQELAYVDFFERVLRFKGTDHYADVRQALGG